MASAILGIEYFYKTSKWSFDSVVAINTYRYNWRRERESNPTLLFCKSDNQYPERKTDLPILQRKLLVNLRFEPKSVITKHCALRTTIYCPSQLKGRWKISTLKLLFLFNQTSFLLSVNHLLVPFMVRHGTGNLKDNKEKQKYFMPS